MLYKSGFESTDYKPRFTAGSYLFSADPCEPPYSADDTREDFFLNVDTNVDVASPDLIISCDVRRDAATCLFLLWILKLQEPRVDIF